MAEEKTRLEEDGKGGTSNMMRRTLRNTGGDAMVRIDGKRSRMEGKRREMEEDEEEEDEEEEKSETEKDGDPGWNGTREVVVVVVVVFCPSMNLGH